MRKIPQRATLSAKEIKDRSDALKFAKCLVIKVGEQKYVSKQASIIADAIMLLKEYEQGRYCTLPHLTEMLSSYNMRTLSKIIRTLQSQTLPEESKLVIMSHVHLLAGRLNTPKIYWLFSHCDMELHMMPGASDEVTIRFRCTFPMTDSFTWPIRCILRLTDSEEREFRAMSFEPDHDWPLKKAEEDMARRYNETVRETRTMMDRLLESHVLKLDQKEIESCLRTAKEYHKKFNI